MEDFENWFNQSDIHFRDSLQFELKSEFFINPQLEKNVYKQEFYLFIPNTLQINNNTYSKEQFYLDQTNLIRYKTPQISFSDLIKKENSKSPLIRLQTLKYSSLSINLTNTIIDELKLFGDIFKRTLIDRKQIILDQLSPFLESLEQKKNLKEQIYTLCAEIKLVRQTFIDIQTDFKNEQAENEFIHFFRYTDEFISVNIENHLTDLLNELKKSSQDDWQESSRLLSEMILSEQFYREKNHLGSIEPSSDSLFSETILYRQGLLNKFMLEALRLTSNRFSLKEKHSHLLGAFAAGIAMFIYMILFWQSLVFGINSLPFVLLVVVFYILKDRIKEGVKNLYYRQSHRWFPDYSTEILSPKGYLVGFLTENFSFINKDQLPTGFLEIRNKDFHEELKLIPRPETIIQYKSQVILHRQPVSLAGRRQELTTIFRFNIHQFLLKTNDALQLYLKLDSQTLEVRKNLLPKIYHLNIIIRNTYLQSNLEEKNEIKKFRVIIDKNGIKRVEQIS